MQTRKCCLPFCNNLSPEFDAYCSTACKSKDVNGRFAVNNQLFEMNGYYGPPWPIGLSWTDSDCFLDEVESVSCMNEEFINDINLKEGRGDLRETEQDDDLTCLPGTFLTPPDIGQSSPYKMKSSPLKRGSVEHGQSNVVVELLDDDSSTDFDVEFCGTVTGNPITTDVYLESPSFASYPNDNPHYETYPITSAPPSCVAPPVHNVTATAVTAAAVTAAKPTVDEWAWDLSQDGGNKRDTSWLTAGNREFKKPKQATLSSFGIGAGVKQTGSSTKRA